MRVWNVAAGPGLALLKIDGELDFAGAPAVRTELLRANAENRVDWLVIDLADVTSADDKGIRSLATAVRSLSDRQPAMRVVAVTRDRSLARALEAADIAIYPHGAGRAA